MKKKKLILSLSVLAIISGAGYAGLAYSLPLLSSQLIRQNGFPGAKVQNFYVTPTGFLIDHISLDSNDFSTIDTITITMNWWDFITKRKIEAITIKDISLTAEIDDAGHLKIAGWDATFPQSSGQSSLLPIDSLLLQGLALDLDTPQGNIRIEAKLSVEKSNETEQTLQYSVWGQQHQLSFDMTGSGKLFANGDIALDTTLNEGRINLTNVELSRASGKLSYQKSGTNPPIIKGQLVAGKINAMEALLQNVNITLDTTKAEALYFKTSPAGYKDITLTGKWMTHPDNHLEAIVTSARTIDVVELLAPQKMDDFKSWAKDTDPMSLTLVAPISVLQNDKKQASYVLTLGNTKSSNQIQADGHIIYDALLDKTSLNLHKTVISTAGGQIDVSPFTLSIGDENIQPVKTTLTIRSVDMERLAKIADVKGLTAKGKLSGTIPLTYSAQGLSLGEGKLKSDGSGTFSYTPDEFPPSLQGDDARMETVRKTLSDFRFSKFSVSMSGALDDKMKTTLNAEGKNPSFGDREIKLNLNLDGNLGAVLKQLLMTIDFSENFQKQINKKSSQSK